MDNLVIKVVEVEADGLLNFINNVNESAPHWFLHGAVIVDAEEDKDGYAKKIYFAIYSEYDFLDESIQSSLKFKLSDRKLSDEEIAEVEKAAAVRAINLGLCAENYNLFGDVLLNKYPEFRSSKTPEIAIIRAALAERDRTITDEERQEW